MLPHVAALLTGNPLAVAAALLPQNVFATSLYTGNGGTQSIVNSLDLAGKGGLVWLKRRDSPNSHFLADTIRGRAGILRSDTTDAEKTDSPTANDLKSFNNNGFTLGPEYYGPSNQNGATYTSWSVARAAKFFDIVTYTGDGTSGRQIPHGLGIAPGMVIIKDRSVGRPWPVWHRALPNTAYNLFLNTTDAQTPNGDFGNGATFTATTFGVGAANTANTNQSGETYVAYLFAHDPDTTNGIIQCGSGTTNANGGSAQITLGWRPQFMIVKNVTTSGFSGWTVWDAARGIDKLLQANSSAAESNYSGTNINGVNDTGFALGNGYYDANVNFVYLAIRAPIFQGATKPQDVHATSLYTGNGGTQSIVNGINLSGKGGLFWGKNRTSATDHGLVDTVRTRAALLLTDSTVAEIASTAGNEVSAFLSNGVSLGPNQSVSFNSSGASHVAWTFARAAKFFDIVTYAGDGTSGRQIPHGLGIAPGMIIVKSRSLANDWWTYHRGTTTPATNPLKLNTTDAQFSTSGVFGADPSATTFTVTGAINSSGNTFVAYLFAHDPDTTNGIIQCGSYSEPSSGTTQVNLGWQPQFLLTKAITASTNWWMFDAARGFSAPSLKGLEPNASAAETDFGAGNYFAPNATGFAVGQFDGSANAQHVYLAIRAPV